MTIQAGSVEVELRANLDNFREGMSEATRIASDSADEIEKNTSKLGGAFDGVGESAQKEFQALEKNATESLGNIQKSADGLVNSLGLLGSSIKALGFGALKIGATSATGALVSLAKKGLAATDFLETSRTAMAGLTGSFEEGNKAMSLAANYWQNNPFQRIDVTNATKQLVQFGRTTSQISSDLEILGNVSLSTGMGIDELARYYARVSSSGRAMTMDIEMMSDRGVPIYRELTKALNTTTEGVRKMASEGKIDFETFRKAMEGAVSAEAMEQYENTMARQTDRLKGSIQIIAGELAGYKVINNELVISEQGLEKAWTRLLKTVATGLRSQGIKDGMQKIGTALAKVVDTITQLVEPAFNVLAKVLDFVGDNAEILIPIIGAALLTFSQAAAMIPGIGGIIAKVAGPINGLKESIKGLVQQRPGLVLLFSILSMGFIEAYKNDEEFRTSIQELVGSLKELMGVLMDVAKGVLKDLVEGFKTLASSDAVKGVLKIAAEAIGGLARAIASIPPENLAGIISFFVALKYINSNPIMVAASAVLLLITYFKQLADEGKNLPETLWELGKDMMVGLFNGIVEGAKAIIKFVKDLANAIVTTLKKALGIHSPSTVMYGLGENVVLGLANGIEDSKSVLQLAMDSLAKDILSLGEKVIGNKVDFGILDIKGQYQEWKKLSKLFTQGSEQYNYAIQKMEDARKQANLQILALQEQYNDTLDQTIDKIANMYGLFDSVDLTNTTNATKILGNLDKQVAKMSEWADAQTIISGLNIDEALKQELASMGVSQVSELAAIANMTEDELSTFNDMWLKKQALAEKEGIRQMTSFKNETLEKITEIKNGIDGETIDVEDIGGRLVSNIGDGITGALPTLDSAFAKLGDYIQQAQRKLKGTDTDTNTNIDTDTNVPDAGDITKSVTEELKNTGAKIKSMIPQILLSLIGAWGLKTFLPKVFSKLSSMVAPGAISGIFKKLFGNVGQAAQEAAKATKPVESIAQSANVMSDGVQNVSKSMSKADKFLDTIKKGAQTVIWIAGAIAAVAAACWFAYQAMKDIDWGKFTICLLEMSEAVIVFGAFAKIADMLKIGASGILVIAGVAADIAIVALACRAAYELMKPIDFVGFQLVLVEMIEALAVFAGFGALFGIFSPMYAAGLLVIAGVAGDIALVGLACKTAYDQMKDIDFEKFQYVLLEMIEALGVMGGFGALLGILAPLEFLGWASVLMICDELVKISKALWVVYNVVPDDFKRVNEKIDLIKSVLNKIIDTDLGSLIGAIVSAIEAGPLERTIDMYVHVAEQLNKLSNLELNDGKINTNLELVKSAIEKVRAKTGVISAVLQSWADDANANSVESAGRVITIYGEIVDTLDKLSNVTIKQSVLTGVTKLTEFVQKVLDTISKISTNWWVNVGAIEQTVGLSQSILNKFSELVPTIKDQIQTAGIDEKKAVAQIDSITNIVYHIGKINEAGGIENKEKIVGYTQSILNKFTELVPVIQQIASIDSSKFSDAINRVHEVQNLVYEIGKIKQAGGIENKEKIVGYTQSILNKFTELTPTIQQLVGMNLDAEKAKTTIANVRDLVWEIGKINQKDAGNLSTKEWVVGMASSIAWKLSEFTTAISNIGDVKSETITNVLDAMKTLFDNVGNSLNSFIQVFENVGVQIGERIKAGLMSQNDNIAQAGYAIQGSLWSAIESKMPDEYNQGAWMATQFGNGLKSVDFSSVGAAIQSSVWWGIQNRMNDEYYQGRSMGERFRQGLYDIDYGNAGWWAVQGFINGAWGRAGSGDGVYHTGWWIANNFLQGLKDRGRQGSPWKTTIESGDWAVQGLIEGIQKQEGALVSEATSLADEVVEALTMDDLSMSPTLEANVAPSMVGGDYGISGGTLGGGITINQTNEVYTELDMDIVNRNLAWDLAKA